MKNLKKLISVIIAVIMIVGSFATVSAADYADVESTNSYAKAIQVLSGLGIAKGDDEGNFNPKNDVKRSEMVAFICRAMGEEDVAAGSATNAFTDVAANHWAAGEIAWGVNRGIINGMGDGTFAPDASVSYQDAVVMIMRALGYDRIAQRKENGGYPVGYLKLASQYGVLKDAGYDNQAAATREIIAQLIFNGLTAAMVDVTEYGDTVEDDKYVIYNGKNRALKNLLTDVNDMYRVKMEVVSTPKSAPTVCVDKNGNEMVKVYLDKACDYYDISRVAEKIGATWTDVDPSAAEDYKWVAKFYVGETDVADYLGYTFEAYVAEDDNLNDIAILAAIAEQKAVVKETIAENLNTIVVTSGKVSYYANLEDRKPTEIEIATAPTVYYNGVEATSVIDTVFAEGSDDGATPYDDTNGLAILLAEKADSITFMGAKNAAYDKIFVTDYLYKRVKSVNADEKLIKFKGTGSLDLDAESRNDEDFIYNIYDANGKAMDIADINEGDVLNIVCPLDSTTIGNYFSVGYLDIYVTNETVTGKVDELKTSGQYVIDGEAYVSTTGLTIGEEGTFFLTIDGKIMDKEAATTVSKSFAFIINVDSDTVFDLTTYSLRIFKADGTIEDLVVADTLKFFDGSDTATILKRKDGTQIAEFGTSGGHFYDAVADEIAASASDTHKDAAKAAAEAKLADRFVTYKTNSANEITEIRLAAANTAIEVVGWAGKKYNAEFNEFGGEDIGEAPLFVAEVSEIDTTNHKFNVDADDLEIANFAALDEDDTYNAMLYTVDGEKELAAVLLDAKPGLAFAHTPLAVVKSLGTKLNDDDNSVESITFVQSGTVKTLKVDYDEYPSATGLAVGDVFQYAVNAAGEITDFELVYNAAARALDTTYATGLDLPNDDVAFVFGVISELDDYIVLASQVDSNLVPTTSEKFKFAEVEGATYAWYEEAGSNNPVSIITIDGLRETVRANAVYAAVAKVNENGRVEDVVLVALDPSVFNAFGVINGSTATWELNPND